MQGINIVQKEHKLALYANDARLYFTKQINALSKLQEEIIKYVNISGFKINYEKSELLHYCYQTRHPKERKDIDIYIWVTTLKHLGVNITKKMAALVQFKFL